YVTGSNTLAVQGVSRVFSVYMHPNNLALYLGRVLPFAVCIALFLPTGWRKLLYLAACVPLGATLILTYSRRACVGVALGTVRAVACVLYWRPGRAPGRNTWVLYVSGAALLLGLALVALPTLLPALPARIFNIGSGIMRLDIWESSWRMLMDHPIFGV